MPEQPNILFFFSDQQRWDTVGSYGGEPGLTPNFDRLASEGVRFEHAFTCQPVCGPARSCIQTGKYATETGCFRNGLPLPQDQKTIAHWLTEAGYDLGYIGKWHLASSSSTYSMKDFAAHYAPGDRDLRFEPVPLELRGGYKDYWVVADILERTSHGYNGYMFNADMEKVEFKGYRVDCTTEFALEFLRQRSSDRPFFLFISYIEPHHQSDHGHYEGPEGSKQRFKDFRVPGDLAGAEGDWRQEYPDYLGCVSSLDRNLGRIMDELQRRGILEQTLIVATSDHGSHFRTRNTGYKRSSHDGCLRVPMILSGPGFRGGKVPKELVSLIDLPPTLLTASGLEAPSYMRGYPLQALAGDGTGGSPYRGRKRGGRENWRREVFAQISEDHVGRALRTHRWKYAVWAPGKDGTVDPDSAAYVERFLYDLEADPHELNNLVTDPGLKGVRSGLAESLKATIWEVEGVNARIRPAPAESS